MMSPFCSSTRCNRARAGSPVVMHPPYSLQQVAVRRAIEAAHWAPSDSYLLFFNSTVGLPYAGVEPERFPRVSMNPPFPPHPLQGTVYDDVASSSTITVTSRNGGQMPTITSTLAPQLPSMAEFATGEYPRESAFKVAPICSMHAPGQAMETFGTPRDANSDTGEVNG